MGSRGQVRDVNSNNRLYQNLGDSSFCVSNDG